MKRFTRALFGALLLLTAFASTALAEWHFEPVKWSHPGITSSTDFGSVALAVHRGFVRDTTWIPMAVARVDTSAEFSLLDCDPIPPAQYGRTAATGDSTALAFVCLVADSSVASTVTWNSTAVQLQVNYGRGAGWQNASNGSGIPTSGQKVLIAPIWASLSALTNDLPIDLTSPLGNVAPRARIIVTGGAASVAAPSTRIYVKKWMHSNAERDAGNISW